MAGAPRAGRGWGWPRGPLGGPFTTRRWAAPPLEINHSFYFSRGNPGPGTSHRAQAGQNSVSPETTQQTLEGPGVSVAGANLSSEGGLHLQGTRRSQGEMESSRNMLGGRGAGATKGNYAARPSLTLKPGARRDAAGAGKTRPPHPGPPKAC